MHVGESEKKDVERKKIAPFLVENGKEVEKKIEKNNNKKKSSFSFSFSLFLSLSLSFENQQFTGKDNLKRSKKADK